MKDIKEINKELDLTGKISVVTGGTSGIGYAIARTFCAHKCRTVILGRNTKRGKDAENEINGELLKKS